MGRGAGAELQLGTHSEELAAFVGSDEQADVLLERLSIIAPDLSEVCFYDRPGEANFQERIIRLPEPDCRLGLLENLISITQTALHEAAHFRYTGRDADALLDMEEERFEEMDARASWKQMVGTLMCLEDGRINESLLREWPALEVLFRADSGFDRHLRRELDVSGRGYYEEHFALLEASDPFTSSPAGIGKRAHKIARKLREVIEFAVAGETTASAVLSTQAVAERLLDEGRWLRTFPDGTTDEAMTVVSWSEDTIEWAKETCRYNPERLVTWQRRRPPFTDTELAAYLATLDVRDPVALQRSLLPG